jgi:hypothetical protein
MPMKEYFVGTCVVYVRTAILKPSSQKSKANMWQFNSRWHDINIKNNSSGSFSSDMVNMKTSNHKRNRINIVNNHYFEV